MASYKLDRTAFKAQTAEQAANHSNYYKFLTWQERLRIANYLNSIAFNYPENEPPKMDKTLFSARGHEIDTNETLNRQQRSIQQIGIYV